MSELWAWGTNNLYGQVGDNSLTNRSSPVTTAAGGTNWKQVSGGDDFTAAIKYDGTLWTWGWNNVGQLGDNTTGTRSSPITTIAGGTNWKQVSTGLGHTAAIKTNGELWVWGVNSYGVLGTNNISNYSSPVTTIAGGTNWQQVACGYYHTAAIKTDGTLWTWGFNSYGGLGTNNTSSYSSPVTTSGGGTNWKQVTAGVGHTAAIKTDGTLWTWGGNDYGQLGDNTITAKSSPITTIAGGTNWKQVIVGYYHTAAIKTNGELWTWGRNDFGQLGNNNTSSYSSPVTTIAGGTNWKSVAGGGYHTLAIKTDGTLWTWGSNSSGQLGDNTTSSRSSPILVTGGQGTWKDIASGCLGNNTAAIKQTGD